jgi:hypothetical protein
MELSHEERLANCLAVIEAKKAAAKIKFNARKRQYMRERYKKAGGLEQKQRFRENNPNYEKEYMVEYRRKFPDKRKLTEKKSQLKKKYGITLDQRNSMLAAQDYCCAICQAITPGVTGRDWHTDHCHSTKKVRGILCSRCNLMLGHALDNPDTLAAGAAYLREHDARIREERSEQPSHTRADHRDGSYVQPHA